MTKFERTGDGVVVHLPSGAVVTAELGDQVDIEDKGDADALKAADGWTAAKSTKQKPTTTGDDEQ